MVAQTPETSDEAKRDDAVPQGEGVDAYVDGWRALNRAMRAGDPWSGDEGNAVFLQGRDADGALAMVDVAPLLGLYDLGDGRAVARVDLDFDGDEDLVLTARTAPRVRLHQNRLADRAHWLGLRLEAGEGTNPEALGAVVRIELEGADGEAPRTLRRARRAGSGYLAQSSAWIRVPVGARGAGRTPRARITVRWPGPDGALEDFGELRADRSYALRQGTGRARAVERPSAVGRGAVSPADPPVVASRLRAVLPTPVAVPGFAVRGVASNPARLFGVTPGGARGTGRALCLVVHDGVDEAASLGALSDASTSATEAGAQAAALDLRLVADEGERSRAAERLRAAGWSGAAFFAAHPDTPALLAEVAGWRFDRTDAPPLPWTFVFAPDGRLAVVRSGAL
ncbi:MAG: ASPIC/UnbV domain-containing protein, partial [Planctomycetota bacterium]